MMKSKMNSFIKQFIAQIKGDDAEVVAEKNWRKAEAFLKVEIATLEGSIVDFEMKVESAKILLKETIVNNGKELSDRIDYITKLYLAKENELLTIGDLEEIQTRLEFITEQYEALKKEVAE